MDRQYNNERDHESQNFNIAMDSISLELKEIAQKLVR